MKFSTRTDKTSHALETISLFFFKLRLREDSENILIHLVKAINIFKCFYQVMP